MMASGREADVQHACDFPSTFHGEADFDSHLPVIHLSPVDTAARFDHLEPAQVLDGFVRALNGLINGVLDGSGRSAGEFDEFIDRVFHGLIISRRPLSLLPRPAPASIRCPDCIPSSPRQSGKSFRPNFAGTLSRPD